MRDSLHIWKTLPLLALLLAGCTAPVQKDKPPIPEPRKAKTTKAEKPGRGWRAEPIIFNGRRYHLAFRTLGKGRHEARLSAPGRRLGGTPGDAKIVREIALAALHHFTCRDSQRAALEPGSLRHDAAHGVWRMKVRCR